MNNTTTTRRNLALVAVFMAATLVVGTLATTTVATTQSAYAYSKKDNGKGNDNGNTVTIEECKNRGSASGFDTALDQECENLICTHPGENATCVQEGVVTPTPTPTTTTTTPKPEPTTGTLLITKICTGCGSFALPFTITFTVGNNPQPSTFVLTPGSSQLVTLGPGTFTIVESGPGLAESSFSGGCTKVGSSFSATGTISAGQQLTCTITNIIP